MTLLARIFVNSWWRTMGLKSAKEVLDPYRAKIRELETKVEKLRTERDAATADAERYRWLRSRDLETVYDGGVFVGKTPDNFVLNFEDCDHAVDSARALKEQP